jgi:uncharacterized NAD(P)/FAD-binding protein YdhS
MKKFSIAIVGLGPRGLNLMERLSALLLEKPLNCALTIHCIDTKIPGQGAHGWIQPAHLLVNTVAGQITMYSDPSCLGAGPIMPGPSFLEWANQRGYCKVNGRFVLSATGDAIQENDYLPRSLLGEYLTSVYDVIMARIPDLVEVVNHRKEAVDIRPNESGGFEIELYGGFALDADYVFLTTGHGESLPDDFDNQFVDWLADGARKNSQLQYFRTCYPITSLASIGPNAKVAVVGTGLSSNDIVSALTVGVGGSFDYLTKDRYKYNACGREPKMTVFSRQGIPFGGRAINQKGNEGKYRPSFFTRAFVDNARNSVPFNNGKAQLDFDTQIWPTLKKEMAYVYHCTAANHWVVPEEYVMSEADHAAIDKIISPVSDDSFSCKESFVKFVHDYLVKDIADALGGNMDNPVKAATDVLRDTRDIIRYAIDQGGLTPESHEHFLSNWCGIINRIAVGPPKERNIELLALMEAGIVEFGIGPAPKVGYDPEKGKFTLTSSKFSEPVTEYFDVMVRAKIDMFEPERSTSPLVRNMLKSGLAVPYQNGPFKAGGLNVNERGYIINSQGQVLENLCAQGNVVEGSNFYTFVLPRPNVNSRSIYDAGVASMTVLNAIRHRISDGS